MPRVTLFLFPPIVGRSRTVPGLVGSPGPFRCTPRLREALAAWLADRPSRPGVDSVALFTLAQGAGMTADAIADAITAITAAVMRRAAP